MVTHGMSTNPLYAVWKAMVRRCSVQTCRDWPYYGGRGITVCDRWLSVENFLADMGPRPDGMTLDRRDNDGNYEPGNVQWATRKEQVHNQRPSRNSSALKTHCIHGHPFDEANTYYRKLRGNGLRMCRACNAISAIRFRERKAVSA